jgi:hypothetical protein
MEKVVSTFTFLRDSKGWSGAVEVLEVTDESGNEHIYMRMRIGNTTVRLPRARVGDVIDALASANADAKDRFAKLLKKLNRGK